MSSPASPQLFADAADVVAYANASGALHSFAAGHTVGSAESLSGGVANAVFRLRLQHTNADSSATSSTATLTALEAAAPSTAIFKYYPPTLRRNTAVAFSQDRYVVEKTALLALSAAAWSTAVRVPRVYHADDSQKVIIMEDIGEGCVALLDFFRVSNTSLATGSHVSPEHMATQLAAFLTKVYAIDASQLSPCFHNTAAWDVLDRHVHQRFEANLEALHVLPDLAHWLPRARPAREPESAVLIMGDLWPNAVHIDSRSGDIWLLDWELARFGSPLSDTRQMLANLFMMEHAPAKFRAEEVARFRRALVQGVTGEVKQTFGEAEQADFMVLLGAIIGNEFWHCDAPAELMRAASAGCADYLAGK